MRNYRLLNQPCKGGKRPMKKKFFLICLCMAVCINLALLFPYTTPPAQSADQIKIKIANFFPPPSKQSKITEEFGKDLEKRSGGRIKVQYFAGGSLLKAPAIYKGIESGITDIGYAHVYYTPGRFPVIRRTSGCPWVLPAALSAPIWHGTSISNLSPRNGTT